LPDKEVIDALNKVKREPPIRVLITKVDETVLIKSYGITVSEPENIKYNFDGNK
jgi:hypothetical protein